MGNIFTFLLIHYKYNKRCGGIEKVQNDCTRQGRGNTFSKLHPTCLFASFFLHFCLFLQNFFRNLFAIFLFVFLEILFAIFFVCFLENLLYLHLRFLFYGVFCINLEIEQAKKARRVYYIIYI